MMKKKIEDTDPTIPQMIPAKAKPDSLFVGGIAFDFEKRPNIIAITPGIIPMPQQQLIGIEIIPNTKEAIAIPLLGVGC